MSTGSAGVTAIALPFFVARPEKTTDVGVVLVHEGRGINQQLLRLAQRLAQIGCTTIAPDLFYRLGGAGSDDMWTLPSPVEPGPRIQVLDDLDEASGIVRALGAKRVAVIGFCTGGRLAYQVSVDGRNFEAAIGFYAVGIDRELGDFQMPTLLLAGDEDEHIPKHALDAVVNRHPEATIVYPGAPHLFFNESSERYQKDAAADAWIRVTAFLDEHLRA